MSEKGITAELCRLRVKYANAPGAAPATMIAKFSCPPVTRYAMRLLRTYEREVRFYQEIADRVGFRTPKCYYSAFDVETADHILLLEEITDARPGDRFAGCSARERYV